MKKNTKNVWLALMLVLALCVSKTHAQQKFDQYGYAIESNEEEALVVNNNQNTSKNVNKNFSQSEAPENTNYQSSGTTSTQTYSSTTSGCCNHRTVNIVNVNVKLTAGVNNFSEPPRERIIDGTRYVYVNNGNSWGYSSGRQFIPISQFPQFCDNRQPKQRKEYYKKPRDNYQQPTAQQIQPVQTYHGNFQNEVHGGQFNNGVHGGQFGNNSGGGTLNPPVTTGGGGGNGTVHHGKF